MKKILLIAAAVLLGSSGAWALGTTANTRIDNNATLSYTAGSVTYEANASLDSNNGKAADSFLVDKKVDMVLVTTDTSHLTVVPSDADRVRTFAFKNEGNAEQWFRFAYGDTADGTLPDYNDDADDLDVASFTKVEYTYDGTTCPGKTSGTATTSPFEIDVPADCNMTFKVYSNIKGPADATDNKVMVIELNATAITAQNGNVESNSSTEGSEVVDVVLADGHNHGTLGSYDNSWNSGATANDPDTPEDGIEIARSGYVVHRPLLSLNKKSCVYDDPVNLTTNPKRIPGARIMYVIDIDNNGTADATDVTITDDIADQLLYNTIAHATDPDTGSGKVTVAENVDSCSCDDGQAQNSGSDVDNTGSGTELKVEGIDIVSGKHTCVSFTVEIE